MNAVIYARFSPRPRRRRGKEIRCESCDTQIERCRAHCLANDLAVIAEHRDEDASGATQARDGWQAALREVCRRKGVLVVYSLSRMARSTLDMIAIVQQIERAGADIVSLSERIDTTSAMGRCLYKIMAAIDEMERERTGERTSDAMRRHQANGRAMSDRTPYGTVRGPDLVEKIDGEEVRRRTLLPSPDEVAILARIRTQHAAGHGARRIARELNAAGVLCRGHRWHPMTIQRIIEREIGCSPMYDERSYATECRA